MDGGGRERQRAKKELEKRNKDQAKEKGVEREEGRWYAEESGRQSRIRDKEGEIMS